ncbi:cold shock domain-containing protein [Paenibacillus phoenicis]|uniref:Cold shock domain-containing protein n=1 Tax=Paenibacillus phoenicis TaxID=554117 RepID=A0ABU5PQ73_9BACL|nr:cold shock domain-containing protein [Paenibacillus phoenicis]MEA3571774.1 cold shock domain-containing protein [Paenibacillus phoenicis]
MSYPVAITWQGLKGEEMAEVYSRIGPSLGKSPVAPPKEKRLSGYVRRYYDDRGFGFIGREDGSDVHFHINAVQGADKLRTGDRVTFEVGEDARGRLTAKNVRLAR